MAAPSVSSLSAGRVALAFLVAPVVAAVAFGLIGLGFGIAISPSVDWSEALRGEILVTTVGLILAVLATIVLGVPVFLILRPRAVADLRLAVTVGGFLGVIAAFAPFIQSLAPERLLLNLAGLVAVQYKTFAMAGLAGALGGVAFWFVAAWQGKSAYRNTEA